MTVYFISDGEYIKIGYTEQTIASRLAALQTGNPKQLVVLLDIPGERNVEIRLHREFKHLRVKGEWFKKDKDLLDFIRGNNKNNLFTVLNTAYERHLDKPKELFTLVFRQNSDEVYVAVDYYPDGLDGAIWDGLSPYLVNDYPYIPLDAVEFARGKIYENVRELHQSALREVETIYEF